MKPINLAITLFSLFFNEHYAGTDYKPCSQVDGR